MKVADILQIGVAGIVLIGTTVLVITGDLMGSDAVTMYGMVLGYAFGVSQGIRSANRAPTEN